MSTPSDLPDAATAHTSPNHHWVSSGELQALRQKLREAQETLEAIQTGDVDAVVVSSEQGSHIYTLTGAEEPYRIFVEQMQEGAATVSESGLILYCNRKFAELIGQPLEKVISSPLEEHFPPEVWEAIDRGLNEEDAVKIEAELSLAGTSVPMLITANKLVAAEEKLICLVVTDLSGQKEKHELAMARDIAEAANKAKDSFLAVLSHELRNPLTPALMAASLLERDTTISEKSRNLVVMIRRNVEIETRLIDDLLDLTRITQGKMELRKEPITVHKIILEALAVCQAELDDSGQTVDLDLSAQAGRISGDPVRIQQIFWNLIRNAGKFGGRGTTITIRSWNEGGLLKVSVTDQGVGIDAEVLPRLFNPFEQGSEDITRRFGGLGLGLVISKSIAEMHEGGGIRASSAGKDHGSCFELTFQTLPEEAAQASDAVPPDDRRGNILLVEDNVDARFAVTMLLESLGFTVAGVGDSKAAREVAADRWIDLIISDIGLPDGSGYDLMTALCHHRKIPGIAMSGFGQSGDVERAKAAGFNVHLVKPVAPHALEAAISEALAFSR